jgi:hypothetical protein
MSRSTKGGLPVDFDTVLGGSAACVDWPACVFWRELMVTYPEAPVLLSVRPPREWLASFDATIRALHSRPFPPDVPPVIRDMLHEVIEERTFGGRIDDDAAERLRRVGTAMSLPGLRSARRALSPRQ